MSVQQEKNGGKNGAKSGAEKGKTGNNDTGSKLARSGQPEGPESITAWSDEDEAKATGLFQILDEHGNADAAKVPKLSKDELIRLYEGMMLSRVLDDRLMPLQRQGRIGFYIECRGQEAGMIGGAHAIGKDDWFVSGLRETAAGIYRGMPLATHMAQMFGNVNDLGMGHQLPCHSGTFDSKHLTMSSCVSSQLPQAVGIAMAARMRGDKNVALGYMGDGGTSASDFHVALNFAAVFKAPVVFVCQNNQWAISTSLNQQTVSKTIAIKGLAYGIPSIRVDGNDVFAVYAATKEAVNRARAGEGPTFIEALTYRLGPHSSSDDPSRYRDVNEAEAWKAKDPLLRFGKWLDKNGVLSAADAQATHDRLEADVRRAIAEEGDAAKPETPSLIEQVFAKPNWLLKEQLADLQRVKAQRG